MKKVETIIIKEVIIFKGGNLILKIIRVLSQNKASVKMLTLLKVISVNHFTRDQARNTIENLLFKKDQLPLVKNKAQLRST